MCVARVTQGLVEGIAGGTRELTEEVNRESGVVFVQEVAVTGASGQHKWVGQDIVVRVLESFKNDFDQARVRTLEGHCVLHSYCSGHQVQTALEVEAVGSLVSVAIHILPGAQSDLPWEGQFNLHVLFIVFWSEGQSVIRQCRL